MITSTPSPAGQDYAGLCERLRAGPITLSSFPLAELPPGVVRDINHHLAKYDRLCEEAASALMRLLSSLQAAEARIAELEGERPALISRGFEECREAAAHCRLRGHQPRGHLRENMHPPAQEGIGRMSEPAFTPGPWAWFGNAAHPSLYLATERHGRRFVMDFVRWGMRGAQPRFQPTRSSGMVEASRLLQFEVGTRTVVGVDAAKSDPSVYRLDVRDIACADAHLIAAAPDLYEALNACLGLLSGNMDGDLPHDADPADMARLALAKARGESLQPKGLR